MGKGEIAQNEQFRLFPQCFLCNLYLTIFQLSHFSCSLHASLNLGQSQNGVLGKGLKQELKQQNYQFYTRQQIKDLSL